MVDNVKGRRETRETRGDRHGRRGVGSVRLLALQHTVWLASHELSSRTEAQGRRKAPKLNLLLGSLLWSVHLAPSSESGHVEPRCTASVRLCSWCSITMGTTQSLGLTCAQRAPRPRRRVPMSARSPQGGRCTYLYASRSAPRLLRWTCTRSPECNTDQSTLCPAQTTNTSTGPPLLLPPFRAWRALSRRLFRLPRPPSVSTASLTHIVLLQPRHPPQGPRQVPPRQGPPDRRRVARPRHSAEPWLVGVRGEASLCSVT